MTRIKQFLGKEYFKIDNDRYDDADLSRMSVNELKSLKSRIDTKIHSFSSEIKQQHSKFSESGKGTSKDWYANKKYILAVHQRILPYLNELIKKRNSDERSLSDYFVDEARIYLKKETFEIIMQNAEREKKLLTGK